MRWYYSKHTWYPNLVVSSQIEENWRGQWKKIYLHNPIAVHLELYLEPINLKISWIVRLCVSASRYNYRCKFNKTLSVNRQRPNLRIGCTFVWIIKIHSVQANDSHLIWNDFYGIVCAALKNLKIGKWNEGVPDPFVQILCYNLAGVTERQTYEAKVFVILLGPIAIIEFEKPILLKQ